MILLLKAVVLIYLNALQDKLYLILTCANEVDNGSSS